MNKKLTSFLLAILVFVACSITLIIVLDTLGVMLPRKVIQRIVHELPAKEPDSYFVPTSLPLPSDAAKDLEGALDRLVETKPLTSSTPSEITLVGNNHDGQIASPEQPTPSEFAILVGTSTPPSSPLPSTELENQEDLAHHTESSRQMPKSSENEADQQSAPASSNSQPTALQVTEDNSAQQALEPLQNQAESHQVAENTSPSADQSVVTTNEQEPVNQASGNQPTSIQSANIISQVQINPTEIPQPQLVPVQPPTVQPKRPAPAVALGNFSHEWQTWNNCGPATLAMNLSFFGSKLNQADIGAILRQHDDDKNVTPEEMVDYAQEQGYFAQLRVNGSSELMKTLLSNDIPVLIETWLEPEPNDGMGHYRLLTGYDDAAEHWIAFDSYVSHDFVKDGQNYEGIILPYAETDLMWRVFNRTYLLIYNDAKADVINAIFGEQLDQQVMWRQALVDLREEITKDPYTSFNWFNLGSTLNALGNYAEAAAAFDQARQLGLPWRMLWYQFGPFEAYFKTQRYDEVIALAYATIATTESIEEVYYWKGQALAATGNPQSAQTAWQQAIELNPSYLEAIQALVALK